MIIIRFKRERLHKISVRHLVFRLLLIPIILTIIGFLIDIILYGTGPEMIMEFIFILVLSLFYIIDIIYRHYLD